MMHYVASKGAVIAMTRSMARELADKNIMVNAIAPGFTHSEGVLKNPDMSVIRNPTVSSRMIKRDMVPEDLTGVLLFLVSDRNRFMTGQTHERRWRAPHVLMPTKLRRRQWDERVRPEGTEADIEAMTEWKWVTIQS